MKNSSIQSPVHPDKRAVQRAFDRAAHTYSAYSVVAENIQQRMLDRLDYLTIQPRHILDIGCGTATARLRLHKLYPGVRYYGVDLSHRMLRQCQRKNWFSRKPMLIQGDAEILPFASSSMDLVVSSLVLLFTENPESLFREVNRVLVDGGVFLFTTLGVDSLVEVLAEFRRTDPVNHWLAFTDMHDLGDMMLQAGLAQPVLDAEKITVTYPGAEALLRELRCSGCVNVAKGRRKGLLPVSLRQSLHDSLAVLGKPLATELEVVQGHAWKGRLLPLSDIDAGVSRFPVMPIFPDKNEVKKP